MGVFTKLFKKTNEKTSAQKAKERLLSVCIAQTNTTGEERSELIQKIKAAVIQVVNEYYQTKLEADKISVGKIDSSDDVIELTVNLPDDQKDGEGEGEGDDKAQTLKI